MFTSRVTLKEKKECTSTPWNFGIQGSGKNLFVPLGPPTCNQGKRERGTEERKEKKKTKKDSGCFKVRGGKGHQSSHRAGAVKAAQITRGKLKKRYTLCKESGEKRALGRKGT